MFKNIKNMFKNLNKKEVYTMIVISILLLGLGFCIGDLYAKKSIQTNSVFPNSEMGRQGGSGKNKLNMQGGNIRGVIDSVDQSQIITKNQDGSQKIILISASTTISKSSMTDLKSLIKGENIIVRGKVNSDGSMTADSVQIFDNLDFSGKSPK